MPRYSQPTLEELLRLAARSGGGSGIVYGKGGGTGYVDNYTPPVTTPQTVFAWDFIQNFEGTNGATTFPNDSVGNRVTTGAGSAALTTTTPLEGVSSLLLSGTLQFATVPSSFEFAPYANFSLEMKIRATAVAVSTIICQSNNTSPNKGWSLALAANGSLTYTVVTDGTAGPTATFNAVSSAGVIVVNTTHTVAISRNSSGVHRVFVDGTQVATVTDLRGSFKSDTPFSIGVLWLTSSTQSTNEFAGRIDAIRWRKGACFVDATSYTVGQTFYEPTPYYHSSVTAAKTVKTKTALNRVIGATGSGLFVYLGTSSMAGLGNNGGINGSRSGAFPAKMGVMLATELSITVNSRGIAGTAGRNVAAYEAMNPAFVFNTGTVSPVTGPGGAMFRHASVVGTASRLTPGGSAFTRVDIYFEDPATGDSIVWATDGAALTGTILGTNTGVPRKLTLTLGAGATYFEWKSGNTNAVDVSIVNPYDHAVNQLHVLNCGWAGSITADWAASKTVAYLALLAPDLVYSSTGINDRDLTSGVSVSTMVANWQTIHTQAQLTSDLTIASPHGLKISDYGTEAAQAPWDAAYATEAVNRNTPLILVKQQTDVWVNEDASALVFDQTHLTANGQTIRAQIDVQYYLEVLRAA